MIWNTWKPPDQRMFVSLDAQPDSRLTLPQDYGFEYTDDDDDGEAAAGADMENQYYTAKCEPSGDFIRSIVIIEFPPQL